MFESVLHTVHWNSGMPSAEQLRAVSAQFFASPLPMARASTRKTKPKSPATIHQLTIRLDGSRPTIWRHIQLPSDATFWELHCAINDAMGWDDSHLHEFIIGSERSGLRIGVPLENDMPWDEDMPMADWDVSMSTHLSRPHDSCVYLYDFGDGWRHHIVLESILPSEAGVKYPRCIDGARACPPENCGGLLGYEQICAALADPAGADEEGLELLEWLGDDYAPEAFDPERVIFRAAAVRLKELRSQL